MINVKAVGAIGNGSNIDTTAIQLAINSFSDGGTTIYPNPASSGAWRRVPD